MTSIEIILTILTILGAIASMLFGFLAFKRNYKKDVQDEGATLQEIKYIRKTVDLVSSKIDKVADKQERQNDRLIKLEVVLDNHVKDVNVHSTKGARKNANA